MRSLASLRKITSLQDVGETPKHLRFTTELLKEWTPLISTLAKTYEIPNRLDAADISQELAQSIWRLTGRVDPVTKPEDFRRLCRTELRNRCVDLARHANARKRRGRTGRAVQCQCCGSVTRIAYNAGLECGFCHETSLVREVETFAKDVSISIDDRTDESDCPSNIDVRAQDPADSVVLTELSDRVRSSLPDKDREVYNLLLDPSEEFLMFVSAAGYAGDHRQAPAHCYAQFLGMSVRDVTDAQLRIRISVTHICEQTVRYDSNKVTLKRLNLA